jgi:hypothetical protein
MTNRKLRGEVVMPWLAGDPVIVLPAHREALEALVRAHSTSQQLALRARMILHAADNIGVRDDLWGSRLPRRGRLVHSRAWKSASTYEPICCSRVLPIMTKRRVRWWRRLLLCWWNGCGETITFDNVSIHWYCRHCNRCLPLK